MKRLVKHLILIFCIILVSLMGTYVGLAVYYHNAFAYGTWINDVYCTGKSIEEVNEELVKDFTYEGIEVSDKDGNTYMISAEQIGYQFDFLKALKYIGNNRIHGCGLKVCFTVIIQNLPRWYLMIVRFWKKL